jgi:hypothetical protein
VPHGDLVVLIDVASGRCQAHHRMKEVFGAAARAAGFLLTAADGGMASIGGEGWSRSDTFPQRLASAWDSHVVALS